MKKTDEKPQSHIKDTKDYYRDGNKGLFKSSDNRAYSFEIASSESNWSDELNNFYSTSNWDTNKLTIGGTDIIPYGASNNLPKQIRDILEIQHLGEGIFKKKRNFLYGQGPHLYKIVFDAEGNRKKIWLDDADIMAWLKSWPYEKYLRDIAVDYYHAEIVFSKVFRNRGPRIGADGMISKLEHVGVHKARLGFPENGKISRIQTGDYDYSRNFVLYPVFDKYDPWRFGVSMAFNNAYSFARDWYPVPSYYGTLNWLNRSSAVPQILKALTDNSLNIRWHIKVPAVYWAERKEELMKNCEQEGIKYTDNLLEDLKDATFKKLADVMAGVKNVGKFFTSEKCYNDMGSNLEEWSIEPIDQKVKDFIDAQINIAKYADSATTSGLGLAPSLSNIIVEGLNSGSEKLYDYKLYMTTEVDIDESIICQTLNDAIEANWPEKGIKIGFYHDAVKTEDSVTSANRLKNQVK
jgi:hypothetical protein